MTIIASDVMSRAKTILQDAGAVRWLLTELATWINDGVREIAIRKPSATAANVILELDAGTRQSIPAGYASLIRVYYNVGVAPSDAPGAACSPVQREIIDASDPNWHDPTRVTRRAVARHVVTDPLDPMTFFVYPGNDGTGRLMCALSAMPVDFTIGAADPTDIASYEDVEINLLQSYQSALLDYVLYRAFSKDMQLAGASDRAVFHQSKFNESVDTQTQQGTVYNTNTTNSQPNS